MIYDLKFYPGKEKGKKDFWRFSTSINLNGGHTQKVEGWMFWPESGHVRPPIISQGKKQIWPIKFDDSWVKALAELVKELVRLEKTFFSEEKVYKPGRAFDDETLEGLLEQIKDDPEAYQRFLDHPETKQGDVDFVKERL